MPHGAGSAGAGAGRALPRADEVIAPDFAHAVAHQPQIKREIDHGERGHRQNQVRAISTRRASRVCRTRPSRYRRSAASAGRPQRSRSAPGRARSRHGIKGERMRWTESGRETFQACAGDEPSREPKKASAVAMPISSNVTGNRSGMTEPTGRSKAVDQPRSPGRAPMHRP